MSGLVRDREAEQLLGLAPGMLKKLRYQGRGPKYVKSDTGRCMGYRRSTLDRWVQRREVPADHKYREAVAS